LSFIIMQYFRTQSFAHYTWQSACSCNIKCYNA
jgi:hypothetical protein